jgi:hypothetical protein
MLDTLDLDQLAAVSGGLNAASQPNVIENPVPSSLGLQGSQVAANGAFMIFMQEEAFHQLGGMGGTGPGYAAPSAAPVPANLA